MSRCPNEPVEFKREGGYGDEGRVRFRTSPSELGDLLGALLNAAAEIVRAPGGAGKSIPRVILLVEDAPDPERVLCPMAIRGGTKSSPVATLGDGGPGDTDRFANGNIGGTSGDGVCSGGAGRESESISRVISLAAAMFSDSSLSAGGSLAGAGIR